MRRTDRILSLARAQTKVINEAEGRISAVVSTETRDRDGDIIRVAGWDLTNFMSNPNLIDSHRYGTIEAIIGRWDSMEVRGKSLVGVCTYDVGQGISAADRGFQLAKEGRGAYSVGFIPDMSKAVELKGSDSFWVNYEFNGQELLEVSQVSVPSNPDALQRMKGLHPALDEIIEEKLVTITVDEGGTAGGGTAITEEMVQEILERLLGEMEFIKRLQTIEDELLPLITLNHSGEPKQIDYPRIFREAAQEALRP